MNLSRPPTLRPAPSTPGEPPRTPAAAPDAYRTEPQWQQACSRVRARTQDPSRDKTRDGRRDKVSDKVSDTLIDLLNDERRDATAAAPPHPAEPLILPAPGPGLLAAARQDTPPAPEVRGAEPPSATAARMAEAVRQVGTPAPHAAASPQVWQVELPGAAPGWQLHIEQARPQAPLALELRVPPVLASQARQQLGDLDRRLREAGHELMRSHLRQGRRDTPRRWPEEGVDEVGP